MRSWSMALLSATVMLAGAVQPARAQATSGPPTSGPPTSAPAVYTVTYFEVAPADFTKAADLLRPFAAASRKEDGNVELTVVDEVGHSGRFAIVEGWRDKAALDAHGAAMKALGDKLQPLFAAPFDGRSYAVLSQTPPPTDAKLGPAMYVLTHIDVSPAAKDDVAALIKSAAEDSRKDKGNERFDALVNDAHPNHFELVEAWTDHLAREAHAIADHTKNFRAKLAPSEGAMYDERLYEVVR